MSTNFFLKIAFPLAEKGIRVFPLIPGSKRPLPMVVGDHFDAASTDLEQIKSWAMQKPDANVGLCPDENFCFLETDDEVALREICADLAPNIWDTTRVSARENRCYFIFRQTMRTRKAGNITLMRQGKENLFEFKQHRVYVTGPGSIHPATGMPYDVEWRNIPAMPDALLNKLCELHGTPNASESRAMTDETRQQTATLDSFLAYYEVPTLGDWFNKGKQWYRAIVCPWESEHENSNQGTSTCIVYTEGSGFGFDCKHRCADKTWRDLRKELETRSDKPAFAFKSSANATNPTSSASLPMIAHAAIAESFLRDNHDFLCVYDAPKRPIAQWVQTRWDVSEDDTLLWRAIADYLKSLYPQYDAPVKGPDPRKRLYDASFIAGVVRCVKPYLPPVKAEVFDRNPHLLGLPNCRVIDLSTNAVREMRREDYITQRINVTPDANCPTPRFDRFISEITCGDGGLANYLLRLCALCLTALPYQALFFLWGRGRNGKGVLIRMLTAILGDGIFAWPLRPSEITVSRFGDDVMKRAFANLKGKRLVTVTESVGGNLNTSMLKLMSGGDALSMAKMRQDQQVFKPTHKVLLPTNDRPQLPADPAFRGRVHMIPFLADFRGREDKNLERTLQTVELPGILHRLITLCPDVIENDLRPPASVLSETDQLFSELDITKQFTDDCLELDATADIPVTAMEKAMRDWLSEQIASGVVVSVSGHEDKADTILRELKRVLKYVRSRKDKDSRTDEGHGRVWVYVGARLKPPSTPSTS